MPLIRLLRRLSDALAVLERFILSVLIALLAVFVLMNVSFRLFDITLAWADELAILAMTLSGFIGASLMLRARTDPAVLLLHEVSSPGVVRVLRMIISALATGFGMVLLWLCWRWFNLPGLADAGFDVGEFEMSTFNYLYTEQTPVLGWPYFWFFLIMPWFAVTLTVHALTNLVEDLGLIEPRPMAQEFAKSEG
ncbi:MAG: TRAP-type C4-dicarboxylate transport system, small permease component [Rhodobacteraceae bacterium HLUCCA12]|nr:MAG: TRAP-type C4-dicarboxylate transport system, small permease component [Rhodobacteraceae bacterium HLUCCA12]